jgi:hypothetical protein
VSYALDVDPLAQGQIAALPDEALIALAEAFAVLQLVPWTGAPYNSSKPDGAMRTLPFSASGLIIYLVVEDRQRVDVLVVSWLG